MNTSWWSGLFPLGKQLLLLSQRGNQQCWMVISATALEIVPVRFCSHFSTFCVMIMGFGEKPFNVLFAKYSKVPLPFPTAMSERFIWFIKIFLIGISLDPPSTSLWFSVLQNPLDQHQSKQIVAPDPAHTTNLAFCYWFHFIHDSKHNLVVTFQQWQKLFKFIVFQHHLGDLCLLIYVALLVSCNRPPLHSVVP